MEVCSVAVMMIRLDLGLLAKFMSGSREYHPEVNYIVLIKGSS